MSIVASSNRELLTRLVGESAAQQFYRGSLTTLFSEQDNPLYEQCAAARELVMRFLGEDMKQRCVMAAPGAVRDYLRIYFAGQEPYPLH